MAKQSYTDAKGRKRWLRNDDVAKVVKQLGEYLIIGGYPEEHAKRYAQLAHAIPRWPDSIDQLDAASQLNSIPGVGGVITGYLEEIVRTGTTEKFNDSQYGKPPPRSVLELTEIERLGPKTARVLYNDYKIDSMKKLCKALDAGELDQVKGWGPKMRSNIKKLCSSR